MRRARMEATTGTSAGQNLLLLILDKSKEKMVIFDHISSISWKSMTNPTSSIVRDIAFYVVSSLLGRGVGGQTLSSSASLNWWWSLSWILTPVNYRWFVIPVPQYPCFLMINPIRCWGLETFSGAKGPPLFEALLVLIDQKWFPNSYLPRLRCFNRKITNKLCATCITGHLFWLVIFPSCCSRQGPPLWNCGNFDHFSPLPTTLNVIWLQKVVPNLPFAYLGKVKTNWQLFPLICFGESQKY